MNRLLFFSVLFVGLFFIGGCDDDDARSTTKSLTWSISGLEDLGSDYAYEGWLIVDGSPVSAGIFTVDASGNLSSTSLEMNATDIDNADTYVLTIEPSPDSDPNPSSTHILAGDFSGDNATIVASHAAALGTDFTSATGSYILATPTDGDGDNNELSGVWWLDPAAGPAATLSLPNLPDGWKYEGWAVIDGTPVTTGTFTSVELSDDSAPYSGTAGGPPFPGEDFLMNAPSGLSFPTNLTSGTIVISVEPSPDNSTAPFLFKPLVGSVPSDAAAHTMYSMNNNAAATNPSGTVSR